VTDNAAAEPVAALCRARQQLRAACNAQADFVDEVAFGEVVDRTWEQMQALDEVICDTVVTTVDGLILQLHLLLDLHDEAVADDRPVRLLASITRGIKAR
jgi:hypothetical protein